MDLDEDIDRQLIQYFAQFIWDIMDEGLIYPGMPQYEIEKVLKELHFAGIGKEHGKK